MSFDGSCSPSDLLALLLHRVQQGDEDAFRELYDLTHLRAAQVVMATVRSPEHTAEVVQELYLHVWQHASSFDPSRGTPLGWLGMLAHRRAVDRVRQVVRVSRREHRDAAKTDLMVPDVAEIGMARHEATRLRAALRQLSELQREAVVLTFIHGYSHQQAAGLLSVPLGTLKTRVRAGVINLRQHLEVHAA